MSKIVRIRVSDADWLRWTEQAAQTEQPLSTFVRARIGAAERVADELAALRRAIEALAAVAVHPAPAPADSAATLEVLLLLRQLAGPGKLPTAHGELRRLGLQVWGANGSGS